MSRPTYNLRASSKSTYKLRSSCVIRGVDLHLQATLQATLQLCGIEPSLETESANPKRLALR
eukprot:4504892-Amphidinium_carterae.1